MSPKSIGFVFVCFLCMFFYSCSSGAYDIEEVEEDIPSQKINTSVDIPKTEIKQEIITEFKKTSISHYSIQLGAFLVEDNARKYVRIISERLGYDVNYFLTNGLYKIRFGDFTSRSEAMIFLGKIQNAGFGDSFITEQIK